MKECHVCHFMCDDESELCPVCGAELSAKPQDEGEETVTEVAAQDTAAMENPVLAASVDSPVTAEIFADVLSENGIRYSTDEKGDFHTGFGGGFFAIDVYVDEKDLDAALDLYRNLTEYKMSFDDFEDFDGDGEE